MATEMKSVVRGFHVYHTVWTPVLGECRREFGNVVDRYAVGVHKSDGSLVGHLPRNISTLCGLFLRRGGSINCEVTGRRRYSRDLPQGGLEIPSILILQGEKKHVEKLMKLIEHYRIKNGIL